MNHFFKVILAVTLSLLLAVSMFALADGDVLDDENRVDVQSVEQVEGQDPEAEGEDVIDATPVENDTPQEIEEDLEELDGEEPEGENSSVSPVGDPTAPEGDASEDESSEDEPGADVTAEEEPKADETADGDGAEEPADGDTGEEQQAEGDAGDESAEEGSKADVTADGEDGDEQQAEGDAADEQQADDTAAEQAATDEKQADADAAAEADPIADEAPFVPLAMEGLVYSGEAQSLVSDPGEGIFLYSLDGVTFSEDIPTATDAGEYTVYYKAVGEEEDDLEKAASLTVIIAKADVTLIPPVAIVF